MTGESGQAPVFIACSHGTAVAAGRSTVGRLALGVGRLRSGLVVRQAFVDVQPPAVADVVAQLASQCRASVVVPLLLSTGFHVRVDIGRAVADSGGWSVAAEPLGAGGALAEVLRDRLTAAGVDDADAVVVTAAGSSDPDAFADVSAVAALVAAGRSGPVSVAYVSSPGGTVPTVDEAVTAHRDAGAHRVAIASYLLAPGRFSARLFEAGADVVTEPLGLDPRVVSRALASYDAARRSRLPR